MTIRIRQEPETWADRILHRLGKSRAYIVPVGVWCAFGPKVYTVSGRESFLHALLRPTAAPLPDGWMSDTRVKELFQEGEKQ